MHKNNSIQAYIHHITYTTILSCVTFYAHAEPIDLTTKTFYVDQSSGDDTHSGKEFSPFKTITHALTKAEACLNIKVSGGNYDTSNGEVFPLDLPFSTSITHNNNNSSPLIITGFGITPKANNDSAAIILNGESNLLNATIDSTGNIGILNNSGKNIIKNLSVINNQIGAISINSSELISINNFYKNNSIVGLSASGNSNLTIINNTITSNATGLVISDNSDIHFEHDNQVGDNNLFNNLFCDFLYEGNKNIALDRIIWDENEFNFTVSTSCSNGNNIVNNGIGSIGYQQIPSQDQPLFDSRVSMQLLTPTFGQTIFTQTPAFEFEAASNIIMIAIWKNPPNINNNTITNPLDIVWYWHSGFMNGTLGRVEFKNGRFPVIGDLNPSLLSAEISPLPLEKGRSYYWAIWGWDDTGLIINASSIVSYFIISEDISANLNNTVVSLQKVGNSNFRIHTPLASNSNGPNIYTCNTKGDADINSGQGVSGSSSTAPSLLILIFCVLFLRNNMPKWAKNEKIIKKAIAHILYTVKPLPFLGIYK